MVNFSMQRLFHCTLWTAIAVFGAMVAAREHLFFIGLIFGSGAVSIFPVHILAMRVKDVVEEDKNGKVDGP